MFICHLHPLLVGTGYQGILALDLRLPLRDKGIEFLSFEQVQSGKGDYLDDHKKEKIAKEAFCLFHVLSRLAVFLVWAFSLKEKVDEGRMRGRQQLKIRFFPLTLTHSLQGEGTLKIDDALRILCQMFIIPACTQPGMMIGFKLVLLSSLSSGKSMVNVTPWPGADWTVN